jgi:hypothetical protein
VVRLQAQIVTHPHGTLRPNVIEQADQVAGQRGDVVSLDCLGASRAAVAALVRCKHVVPGLRKRRHDATPRVTQARKTMRQPRQLVLHGHQLPALSAAHR